MAILRAMQDFGTGFFEGAAEQIEPTMQRRAERQAAERKAEREDRIIEEQRVLTQIAGATTENALQPLRSHYESLLESDPDNEFYQTVLGSADSKGLDLRSSRTQGEVDRLRQARDAHLAAGQIKQAEAFGPLIESYELSLEDPDNWNEHELRRVDINRSMVAALGAAHETDKLRRQNNERVTKAAIKQVDQYLEVIRDPMSSDADRSNAAAAAIKLSQDQELQMESVIEGALKMPMGMRDFSQMAKFLKDAGDLILPVDKNGEVIGLNELNAEQLVAVRKGMLAFMDAMNPNQTIQNQLREQTMANELLKNYKTPESRVNHLRQLFSGYPDLARRLAELVGIDPSTIMIQDRQDAFSSPDQPYGPLGADSFTSPPEESGLTNQIGLDNAGTESDGFGNPLDADQTFPADWHPLHAIGIGGGPDEQVQGVTRPRRPQAR